jgi:hypothetical protein
VGFQACSLPESLAGFARHDGSFKTEAQRPSQKCGSLSRVEAGVRERRGPGSPSSGHQDSP